MMKAGAAWSELILQDKQKCGDLARNLADEEPEERHAQQNFQKEERSSLVPGSYMQNLLLYQVACCYEVALREYMNMDPLLWETVNFWDNHNRFRLGQIVLVHAPESTDGVFRFNIQVRSKGNSDECDEFVRVKHTRVVRIRKYLGNDDHWRSYAVQVTGYPSSEV